MKMFKEDKEAWLDALRSGEYKQCTSVLYSNEKDAYCCLGVLQSCLMDGKIEQYIDNTGIKYRGAPSDDFNNLFGIVGGFSNASGDFDMKTLMSMNDSAGLSFVEIADCIEKKVNVHTHARQEHIRARIEAVLNGAE